MRLPFFKSSKTESLPQTKFVLTPPRRDTGTARFATRPPATESRLDRASEASPRATTPGPNGPVGIPLSVRSIMTQLPSGIFSPGSEPLLAHTTIAIPADLVLAQLSTGKVTIRLSELLQLLPADMLRRPFPVTTDQQVVALPLADLVAAIPSDALAVEGEAAVHANSEEMEGLPNLFDDALLQEPVEDVAAPAEPVIEPAVESDAEPLADSVAEPVDEPESAVTEPADETMAAFADETASAADPFQETTSTTECPQSVSVSLHSLVAMMPDRVFAKPRAELCRTVDLNMRIQIPLEPLLPQLQCARIALPLATVIEVMPPSLFVCPLPQIANETVPIPLQEIVAQLPSDLFGNLLQQMQPQQITVEDPDVPTPFHERMVETQRLEISEPEPATTPAETPSVPFGKPVQRKLDDTQKIAADVQKAAPVEQRLERTQKIEFPDMERIAPRPAPGRLPLPADQQLERTQKIAFPGLERVAPAPASSRLPSPAEQRLERTQKIDFPIPKLAPTPKPAPVKPTLAEDQLAQTQKIVFPEPAHEAPQPVAAEKPVEIQPPVADVTPAPEPVVERQPEPVVDAKSQSETAPIEAAPVVEAQVPQEPVTEATPETEPVATFAEAATTAPIEFTELDAQESPEPEEAEQEIEQAQATVQEAQTAAAAPVFDEAKFLADLNRCTADELMKFRGIGPALAQRIVEFRTAHGLFASLDQLRQIPGIGRRTFCIMAGTESRPLNRLLGVEHNNELTLQEIVRLTNTLPGVAGCILAMGDGVFLTGQLPPHLDQNAVSVFAPQLFKKVGRYVRELRVGRASRITIFTDQQPVSIFQANSVYLVVVHHPHRYSKALLRRCEKISQEIARLCLQRAVV